MDATPEVGADGTPNGSHAAESLVAPEPESETSLDAEPVVDSASVVDSAAVVDSASVVDSAAVVDSAPVVDAGSIGDAESIGDAGSVGEGEGEAVVEPETQAEVDVGALSAKAQKADEYLDLAQRTRAEFENYRKRAIREAAVAQERGAAKLALELLPAVDNLERALAHADSSDDAGNGAATFVSGIKHVHAEVIGALERAGIESYWPEGEQFDPQHHEAVAQQPVDGARPGTVVEVFQRGYRLGENVLRPARVVVAG